MQAVGRSSFLGRTSFNMQVRSLGRCLGLALALTVLAGCSSRSIRAPITDMSEPSGQTAVVAHAVVPAPASPSTVAPAAVPAPAPAATAPSAPTPAAPAAAPSAVPATGTAATPAAPPAPETAASTIKWQWPHKGRIIRPFSAGGNGIDIEGKIGDPILAAADGQVRYVGNGMRGMGNLLLIWHVGDYITAYGHNDEMLVKDGDRVKQGQKIATLGQSDTTSPRLHFEIRRSHKPVDPLAYLPPQ